jgi:hypothetical protein
MTLPADAPKMLAIPYTPPTRPNAMPRFSRGTSVPISAVAIGRMPPPPIAWIARAPISIAKLPVSCDSPQAREPRPNSAIEIR